MTKRKYFKACVIDLLCVQGGHLSLEVVIESCRGNLYVARFEAQFDGKVPKVKNNDFSAFYMQGHYYGFGVNWKYITSHQIDWSKCRLSEKLQRRMTA